MKTISHALTTLAALNFALSPAIAIEPHLVESLPSTHTLSDGTNPIEDATDTNYRRCVYIIWAKVTWCISW